MINQFFRWGFLSVLLAGYLLGAGEALAIGWKADASTAHIPPGPLIGKIHGERFRNIEAKIENGILSLREGEDFFADREIMIFLFLKEGENIFGKKYKISPHITSSIPHIHMKWKPEGQNLPETEMFMNDYSMQLEFSGNRDGQSMARIYLALPDEEKSYVYGNFSVAPEVAPPPAVIKAEEEEPLEEAESGQAADIEQLKAVVEKMTPMSLSGFGVAALGYIILMVASLWYLINAFRAGIGWGLLMFVPVVNTVTAIIFLFARWSYAKRPFLCSLVGLLVMCGGIGLAFYGMDQEQLVELAGEVPSDLEPYESKATEGLAGLKNKVREIADLPVEETPSKTTAGPLVIGDSMEKMERELGEPQGHVGSGNQETYFYNGLEIWVEGGKISNIIER